MTPTTLISILNDSYHRRWAPRQISSTQSTDPHVVCQVEHFLCALAKVEDDNIIGRCIPFPTVVGPSTLYIFLNPYTRYLWTLGPKCHACIFKCRRFPPWKFIIFSVDLIGIVRKSNAMQGQLMFLQASCRLGVKKQTNKKRQLPYGGNSYSPVNLIRIQRNN